jgi:hypothetical protein
LDMRKAYDRLEWDYLRAIMVKLGFHRIWVEMVMRLVSTVSFSVLFNGDRLESFKPSRGTYPSIGRVIQSLPISSCWQQRAFRAS